ncbi:tetratricopeptide repeat protein [Microbulbifer sp. ANSA003]|uniref:tetratricopeptide repeat protein n=1 Tax=Microbulbifer sp. ANSA003 TaxID=3243360 RepID=UPI004043414D
MKASLAFILVLFASGCAQFPPKYSGAVDVSNVLSGRAILNRPVLLVELPNEDLLGLDADVLAYLDTIAPAESPSKRLQSLVDGYGRGDFHVEYDPNSTLPASKTYQLQRGNCLAFTLMMVAMARELGVEAYFNEVDVPPVWGQDDLEVFTVYRHVNMVSEHRNRRRVIDFNLAVYDPIYKQQKLEDSTAFALYYSNRGVELMRTGDKERAFLYLRKALQLQPERGDLWSNLGAFYSYFDLIPEAEQSYLHALQLQRGNLVAASNLERLYRKTGRERLADDFAGRVRYHRNRNPYYLYYQAREAYENNKFKLAEKRLRMALRADQSDHRFHFLLGLIRYQLGDLAASKKSFTEAFSLVSNLDVKNRYMSKLALLLNTED